jgi:hypothetical protein
LRARRPASAVPVGSRNRPANAFGIFHYGANDIRVSAYRE